MNPSELERAVAEVPWWWHSIDLGHGVMTPGSKSQELLEGELRSLRLPDLRGKTVLDIGAWDGFYSFVAERLGAARVVALDHYVWSIDWARAGDRRPITDEDKQTMVDVWRPTELPGKRGFDLAREALGSTVEVVVDDFMTMDITALGQFDVVLFLGVVYHMESPVQALRRVHAVTREMAVIESHASTLGRLTRRPLLEFHPFSELAGDPTNWWSPNLRALHALCRAVGFRRVETLQGPSFRQRTKLRRTNYRAAIRALQ